MTAPPVTCVLLDFFGTLVGYSPSRTAQGYRQSHALARALGARIDYPGFLGAWRIDHHLAAVVTSVGVGWRKPHPARYAAALSQLEADPAAAVFVGDTYDADYAGPVAAGMTAFLIDPGCRHDIPAGRRLGSLADLPARLRDLGPAAP